MAQPLSINPPNATIMIRNYFLLFFRNLRRQKLFSIINLLGLTTSITSTVLIYLFVQNELSYDRFHANADRIYRINQTFIWGESDNRQFASTGPGVSYAVKEDLPEAELVTSIYTPGDFPISYTNAKKEVTSFEQGSILAADSNFFKMFSFELIKGNKETALLQSQAIVLTESVAKRYFGSEDPMGKMLRVGKGTDEQTYEVTGVLKDFPDNSYIKADMLMSMTSFPLIRKMYWNWIFTQLETFIRLDKNATLANTKAKLAAIPRKHAAVTLERVMNMTYDDYIKTGKKWELFMQPLTSIHLPEEPVLNRISDSGSLKIVYSLIGAGIFIILLSCINFMNLSTAQFTRRLKEASVRKILGLGRLQLSVNYFIEALIFCLIAMIVGLAIAQIALPGFNYITEKNLHLNLLHDPSLAMALLGILLLMSFFSGSYPALFLSSFNPIEAIKGKLKIGREGKSFRNMLVIFQFSISIILIISTAVVFQQLNYVTEKDLGFDKENLLSLSHVERVTSGEALGHQVVQSVPGAKSASWCSSVPPNVYGGDKFSAEGLNGKTFPLNFTTADENYIPTLGIHMKYGRNFSKDIPGDAQRVILNEAAIKQIGWEVNESVIGRKITYQGDTQMEIAGVVQDFNYWSLMVSIQPMAIFNINVKGLYGMGDKRFLIVRFNPQGTDAWKNTLSSLETVWKAHANDNPFDYAFVDQSFAKTFKSQQQFGSALTVMAGLAILIACLGLLGMIVYTLEQRTKEIGIRKVSGASAFNIVTLISKDYTKLIVIAFIIGAPAAFWLMQTWLQDFEYRIKPSLWIFALAGISTLAMAMIITSYHSIKAALTNPVDVLKDE